MPGELKLEFAPFAVPAKGVLVMFCEEGLKFGAATEKLLKPTGDLVARAAAADRFKGKNGAALEIVAPSGLGVSRLIVIGVGKAGDLKSQSYVKLGGVAMGKVPARRDASHDRRRSARRAEARSGGRHRARGAAARLCVRPLQDQAQGRRGAAQGGAGHDRGGGRRRGAEGLRVARRRGERRGVGARSRQRTGQCALSDRVRPPRRRTEKARRRRRGASTSRR